ncbi:MAG: DUF4760 domain-containing protein [Pseudomonadota bacterium]
MNWLDAIAEITTIAASVAVIVTTGFVWRQLSLQAQDVDTDVRRFQRESLSAIHETLQDEAFRSARSEFFAGPHQLAYSALTDQQMRRARFILSVYALMTRMVGSGAVDEALYRDYWGTTLRRDWDRLENFISGERLGTGEHAMFSATETLVARWSSS